MSERGNDSGARPGGIGARLQAARERADLSVVQAAELLHVDPAVVHALESEHFDELGAAVYVRGHMRHYAELVKESAPQLLGLYEANVQAGPPPDLTLMPHVQPQAGSWRGALAVTGLALVIGVGLIGSIRWIYLDLNPGTAVTVSAPAPTAIAPAPNHAPEEAPEAAAVLPTKPTVPATPDAAAGDGPAAATDSAPRAVARPTAGAATTDASVTLKFGEACWTAVYDARGGRLYQATAVAGAVQTLRGVAPLKVVVGNVAGVRVEVNGQARAIPLEAQSGRVAQFLVTGAGTLTPLRHVTTAGNDS